MLVGQDEKEMGPDHSCPVHRTECKLRHEENYFFRLSKCALLVHQPACSSAGTCTCSLPSSAALCL